MQSSPLLSVHPSPSPPSPAESSSSSSRGDSNDSSFSFDMSLDPSDPLNFLLYPDPNSQEDSVSHPMWPDQPSSFTSLNGLSEDDLSFRNSVDPSIPQFKLDGSFMNVNINSDMSMNLGMNTGSDMDFSFQPTLAHMPSSIDDFDSNIFNQAMLSLGLDISQLPTTTTSSNDYLSAPNQLSFQNLNQDEYAFSSPSSKSSGRRLSITSSSSSSNASLSPLVEHANTPSPVTSVSMSKFDISAYEFVNVENMVRELAQRARERAGVISALPISSADVEVYQQQAAKVAIPRLTRPAPSPPVSSSAAKNKAQILPPSPSETDAAAAVAISSKEPLFFADSNSSGATTASSANSPSQAAPPHKPKTSHTTIERRYRTNLNARIQALRNAVPALRVLEQRDGNRVGNLGIKIPDGQDDTDVIDARGYVDGVKVARKGSKANVLGKAVEYIRVLKRRELRLRKEQMGLKILLCTLIGGSELLKEWEKEWANKYGGPERDEIDTDGEDGDGESEEEDDGDDDDKEREDSVGKKRKRTKVDEKATKAAPLANVLVIAEKKKAETGESKEKKKRGRPRKSAATLSAPDVSVNAVSYGQQQDEDVRMAYVNNPEAQKQQYVQREIILEQAQEQPQLQVQPQQGQGQYLLAAFAFFSFFNSPGNIIPRYYNSNSNEQYHTHTGSVLTHDNHGLAAPQININGELPFSWRDAMHIIHLLVSALLFLSIVLPWLPRAVRGRVVKFVPSSVGPLFGFSSSTTTDASTGASVTKSKKRDAQTRRAELISVLQQQFSSTEEEFERLRLILDVHSHWWSAFTTIPRVYGRFGPRVIVKAESGSIADSASIDELDLSELKQKAWMRLADIVALKGTSTPLTIRLQIYLSANKCLSSQSAKLAADLATLALVIKPFWSSKAEALWSLARNSIDIKAKTSAVSTRRMCKPFESYVLEKLDVDVAAERLRTVNVDTVGSNTPLGVLAAQLIRDSVCKRAERIFIGEVLGEEEEAAAADEAEDDIRKIVEVGRCLDERTTELVNILESVQSNTCSRFTLEEIASNGTIADAKDEDSGIFSLLHAIILYRRTFPSASTLSTSSTVISPHNPKCASDTQPVLPTLISAIPSPPPSPCRKNAALHLALRRALDSSAFDRGDALEDARDCVVDLLTTS